VGLLAGKLENTIEDLRIDMRVIKCTLRNFTTTVQHDTLRILVS
jgi:hypothetical protein